MSEKTIDALVGHAEGDASRRAYAGVGVPTRHEHLRKVRHPQRVALYYYKSTTCEG